MKNLIALGLSLVLMTLGSAIAADPLTLEIKAKDAAGNVTHEGTVTVPAKVVIPPPVVCPGDPSCPPVPPVCPGDPSCPLPPTAAKQYVKLAEVGAHAWGSDSATWGYVNDRAKQPWQRGRVGGNWLDANGVPEGAVPFASLPILSAPAQAWMSVDVTTLVRAASYGAHGIFVAGRQVSGYPPKFASRQHANGNSARLSVTTSAGVVEIPVQVDTWLTVTSNASQALTDYWSPSGILVFDLSAVKGDIISAQIKLWPTGWFGGVTLDFYLFDPPELLTRPAEQHPELVTTGLSATLTDAQLKTDPRVLAFMDPNTLEEAIGAFNSGWIANVNKVQQPSIVDWGTRKALRVGNGPDAQGATAVNAVVQTVKNPGARYNKPWMADALPQAPKHLFVSYLIKVPTFTAAIEGAKLPSLDGDLHMYSYQDWPSQDTWPNDWSWGTSIHHYLPSQTNDGVLGLGVYMYDQDAQFSNPNRGAPWHTNAALIPGREYHIEIEAKVNTCTAPNVFARDGIWRVWLDGVLVYQNLAWPARAHPNVGISATRMLIMHGGNNRPTAQQWYEISRFILSTERVGPPRI